jgi:hypothetical protein
MRAAPSVRFCSERSPSTAAEYPEARQSINFERFHLIADAFSAIKEGAHLRAVSREHAMPALLQPRAEDIVLRRESFGSFTIGVIAGAPQIACRTLEEALRRAAAFASAQDVQLWYGAGDGSCTPLADIKLLRKVWNEFIEMPGLRLTREQAQRLWAVDADACVALLDSLVDLNFLVRASDGRYARPNVAGKAPDTPLRMARIEPTRGELPRRAAR